MLRNFLQTHLGYENAGSVEMQRVHCLKVKKSNASNDTKPNPIIARFLRYKDCERILSLGHRLKGTEFRMYQDLPYGIVERRRKQMDTFKLAKRNKIPAAFSLSLISFILEENYGPLVNHLICPCVNLAVYTVSRFSGRTNAIN